MSAIANRHKQYYDFTGIQNDLFQRSREGTKNFKNLLEIVISDENILLAYRQVKSNTGSKPRVLMTKQFWILLILIKMSSFII